MNEDMPTGFDIFPAIDLLDGHSVRLHQGKKESAHRVHHDPLQQIQDYADAGARWVHVVNLNAAFGDDAAVHEGARHTEAVIQQLVTQGRLKVQLGGGLRSSNALWRVMELGVERVVIGTWAVTNFDEVMEHVQSAPERFVIGVDSLEGRIAIRGWTQTTAESTLDFTRRLKASGVQRVLFTDVARDGMLQGAAIDATARLAHESGLEVIASGGVNGLDDLRALSHCRGVCGVVTGQALASQRMTLSEALAFQRG
jgi:phosphoribosylformimino-5-aminoimidazole carboxamide ribotide isomerase